MQPSLEKSNAENLGKFSRLKEDVWVMGFQSNVLELSKPILFPFWYNALKLTKADKKIAELGLWFRALN